MGKPIEKIQVNETHNEQVGESYVSRTIGDIYNGWANNYDLFLKFLRLIGYRTEAWRQIMVDSLELQPGNTVVDLCCGTGLSFPYLHKTVGLEGLIIGVDISKGMLEQAEKRVKHFGWKNIELVHADLAQYEFPEGADAMLSAGAFGYIPEYDALVKRIYDALPQGGRFAELGGKLPKSKLGSLALLVLMKSFFTDKKSFEHFMRADVWKSVEKYFDKTTIQEFYMRTVYIVTGEKTERSSV